jgi:glycosyltransferase involved in cell wall biosynthesis
MEISYVGNIGIAQNLRIFVDVAARCPKFVFNIVGEGTEYRKIRNHCDRKELSNVKFYGRITWKQVIDIYQKSDILYAQLSNDFEGAMPSKIYEYLATGKFLIYGGGGVAEQVLSKFENNEVVKPDSASILEDCINRNVKDRNIRTLSVENRELIKKLYVRENNVRKFFDLSIFK